MSDLFFNRRGKGKTVLLIHGFPMDSTIWDNFSTRLADDYCVITVDLPGFGKSKILSDGFSLQDVAEKILTQMNAQKEKEIVVIGHSLGGYVGLAMVEKNPILCKGLGLFHSTAYPDDENKKQSRNKVIDFIETQGVEAFTASFIAPLFGDPTHPELNFVREINLKASKEAVLGYTKAMRDRPDRTHVLKDFQKPIIFISGEKDPGISVDSILRQEKLCKNGQAYILQGQAHMALVEDVGRTSSIVAKFVAECYS